MVEKVNKIVVPSIPEKLSDVEELVDQVREAVGISDEMYGNIIISITEAVNNAIIHGNDCDPEKKVVVECDKNGGSVTFRVIDEGEGFDHTDLPDPTDPDNLEKLTGRGVFLMRQLSDYLIYSNGGNTVEMKFKL